MIKEDIWYGTVERGDVYTIFTLCVWTRTGTHYQKFRAVNSDLAEFPENYCQILDLLLSKLNTK